MPTNDFLPFGTAGGANVLAQADWLALAARLSGYTAGVANSAQINKGLRQTAAVAAAFGQFLNDYGGLDALDDGNIANLVRDFARSMQIGKFAYGAAAGTANALTVTLTPQPASWASLVGAPLNILLTATNTGAATLAINGLAGTKSVLRPGGAALVAGDLGAGGILRGIYDGTAFQLAGLTQASARQTIIYQSPGTYTWVCPAGVFFVRVMVWAGGGGGGGATAAANSVASAGGGGEYREGYFAVVPGNSYTIVVGAGGAAGNNSPSSGGNGGSSSFGGVITALGGGAGVAANGAIQSNGGAAGTGGSGGIIARSGMAGGIAYPIGSGQFVLAQGGPAYTSNFTYTIATGSASNGATGMFPGGGASGGALSGSGGQGAGGQVILEF